jgi:glycosyltransferase involved in cell wall biosynthesis
MRIAQVAPPLESVPPARYGGTERVIHWLTEELVKRGHQVTLFAPGDSRTSARLVPTVDKALWHREPAYEDFAPLWSLTVGKVQPRLGDFDIVHSHIDHFGFPLARSAPDRVLTTLHSRLDLPQQRELYREFLDVPLVSISNAQRCGAPSARWLATVHHGIDLSGFTLNQGPGSYLAFLGRLSPEKGVDTAIRVARRTGVPLRIAARTPLPSTHYPEARRDWEYYQDVVMPELKGPAVELIGEVSDVEKNEFLGSAMALLLPIRWPEPFGLVMPEALACGTPVIALGNGSVPEVIENGVTGFVCEDEDDLTAAIQSIDRISRARCRSEAERRFSSEVMVEAYEGVYARLLEQAPMEAHAPANR